jgi:hypothetical protein
MTIKKRYIVLAAITFVAYSLAGLSGLQFLGPIIDWPGELLVDHPIGLLFLVFVVLGIAVAAALHIKRGGMPLIVGYLKASAAILVGLVITAVVWHSLGAFRCWRALAHIEKQGILDLVPTDGPAPAEADNAVYWFSKARDSLKGLEGKFEMTWEGRTRTLGVNSAMSGALATMIDGEPRQKYFARVVKIVRGNKKAVNLAVKAASKSKVHWGSGFNGADWDALVDLQLPEYFGFMQLAKVLALSAALDAEVGNRAAAAKKLRAGLALAHAIGKEPIIYPQMVAIAVHKNVLRGADAVFKKGRGLESVTGWKPFLETDMFSKNFSVAMKIELLMFGMALAKTDKGLGVIADNCGDMRDCLWFFFYRPFILYDLASGMEYRGRMVEALGKPYEICRKEVNEASEDHEKKAMWLSRRQAPRIAGLSRSSRVNVARLQLINAAIKIRKSKASGLKWLKGLKDPFTEKPYVVLKSKGGLTIYSLGPDGKDDKGAKYDRGTDKGDVARFVALP